MKEITCIRFNKIQVQNDILATVYVVGEPFFKSGMPRPLKIMSINYTNKTKRDRLVVEFEDKTYHELDVLGTEIFYREKDGK